jgi:hypothetical protein
MIIDLATIETKGVSIIQTQDYLTLFRVQLKWLKVYQFTGHYFQLSLRFFEMSPLALAYTSLYANMHSS